MCDKTINEEWTPRSILIEDLYWFSPTSDLLRSIYQKYREDVIYHKYIREDVVREVLREEFQQFNYLVRLASEAKHPIIKYLILVEKSIDASIEKMKGGKEE